MKNLKNLAKRAFKGRVKVGTLFNVPIYLTVDFRIYFGVLFGLSAIFESIPEALYLAGILGTIYGCVVIHEYAHIFMARHYGVDTNSITILILGGVADLQDIPHKGLQEFWVAIVGPMSNIVLACLFYMGAMLQGLDPTFMFNFNESFLLSAGSFNVIMAGFNLLPAFPMDGGRIFRSLIGLKMDFVNATKYAFFVGLATSVGMLYYAIFIDLHIFMILIGILVPLGGYGEYLSVKRDREKVESERDAEERFQRFVEEYTSSPHVKQIVDETIESEFASEGLKEVFQSWKDRIDAEGLHNRGGS